jgi:uncharacterized iron-regulated membrane protein
MSPSTTGGLFVGIILGFLVGSLHTKARRTFRDYRNQAALARGTRQRRWVDFRNALAIWVGVVLFLIVAAFGLAGSPN